MEFSSQSIYERKYMKRKKLLVIAYDYPPNGITSSRRPGGMVKYLPEFGWECVVLTRQWTKENCNYDSTIVPNMPDVEKFEIDDRQFNISFINILKSKFVRIGNPSLHPYSFFSLGRLAVDQLVDEKKIDAIWSTSPPGNVLELAKYAASKSKKPWVADFRDVLQWAPNLFAKLTMPMRVWHERNALSFASAITAVSQGFANTLQLRHGRHVNVISHGYDLELIPIETVTSFPKFNIVFTGGIVLGNPDLSPLLDAISKLIERNLVDPKDISIDFYGKGNEKKLAEMFGSHKYAELVKNHGPVPREKVVQHQREAALLLSASHPGMTGWITSKIFEYVVAGRPILSIPRDDDCIDDFLALTGAGISCSSVEDIEENILAYYKEWKSTGNIQFKGDKSIIDEFSGKAQAKKLALLLDELCEKNA
jgi:glycosyltransferase involved in cell wall biosynthesis